MLNRGHSCISIGSLCHPMSRRVKMAASSVLQVNLSPILTVCSYITNDNQLTLTLLKEEKIESQRQNILRKQQILCNTKEIVTLKKDLSLFEYFHCTMLLQQKMRKLKLTLLPTPKWPAPVQVHLDDDNLPDEIKILVSEGNVESLVYYEIFTACRPTITWLGKKTTKPLDIPLMNSFGLKERLSERETKKAI